MTSLRDLAHVRSGDKGDTAQFSVIAYDDADYPAIAEALTPDRIMAHLSALPSGTEVNRTDLPGIGALLFVLRGAFQGGVTRSLALDAHGKTLAMQLLDFDVVVEPGR